jgi:hypothetical protein
MEFIKIIDYFENDKPIISKFKEQLNNLPIYLLLIDKYF